MREWPMVALGDHVDLLTGYPFKSKDYTDNPDDTRLISGYNIMQGYLRWDITNRWPVSKSSGLEKYRLQANDVVLAMDRPWIDAGLKYAWMKQDDLPCLLVQRTARLRGSETLDIGFLRHLIGGPQFTSYTKRITTGTAVPHISPTDIKSFRFLLPSLPEQRKIANILSTWDEAIVLTERRIQAARRRKKGLMQRLLTGRVRIPEFEEKWKKFEFSDLFETRSSRNHQVRKSEYTDIGKYPIVDQGQQLIAGYTDCENPIESVPVIVFGDHTRALKWVDFPFVVGADGTQLLSAREPCELLFGYYLLHTAHVPNLGYSRHFKLLKEMVFSIPTNKEEQRRITAVLQACDREIDLLSQKRDALQRQKKGLVQRLLTGRVRVKV